ncbi:hypothetical protein RJ640_010624 [Escallonia rubra]|uniref:GDSL esterase/lipase n=1 Tax=Escallonia rubra TaxID=112253 RepID=A0AA88UTW7_9ASTE|nr:hypothetical protein RJ640_010624 [Escallonia rubra]
MKLEVALAVLVSVFAIAIDGYNCKVVQFIFGDSLSDVGNNDRLPKSLARASLPWYGIDFGNGMPNGRFTNGRTVSDIIGDKMGLPRPPAYLDPSLSEDVILANGVNYASGGGGILNETGGLFVQRFSLYKQIELFQGTQELIRAQIGKPAAEKFFQESQYVVALGSNDFINNYLMPVYSDSWSYNDKTFISYLMETLQGQLKVIHLSNADFSLLCIYYYLLNFKSNSHNVRAVPNSKAMLLFSLVFAPIAVLHVAMTLEEYALAIFWLKINLILFLNIQMLHSLGARKLMVFGLGPMGCIPLQRVLSTSGGCQDRTNKLALSFNQAGSKLLEDFSRNLPNASYRFGDAYEVVNNVITNPSQYGFSNAESPCCSFGKIRPALTCIPVSTLCKDRSKYVFWDEYHPSDSANELIANELIKKLGFHNVTDSNAPTQAPAIAPSPEG